MTKKLEFINYKTHFYQNLFTVKSLLKLIVAMDSDEDALNDIDSGNESSGDDVDFAMEVDVRHEREKNQDIDDFPFEVLSTDNIVQHMIDCIKEVNTVLQVSLNNFFFKFLFDNIIHNLVKLQNFVIVCTI